MNDFYNRKAGEKPAFPLVLVVQSFLTIFPDRANANLYSRTSSFYIPVLQYHLPVGSSYSWPDV